MLEDRGQSRRAPGFKNNSEQSWRTEEELLDLRIKLAGLAEYPCWGDKAYSAIRAKNQRGIRQKRKHIGKVTHVK